MAWRRMSPRIYRWLTALTVNMTAVAALTAVVLALYPHIPPLSALVLYLLVIVPAAIVWGTAITVVTALLCAAVYDFFLTPPGVYSFLPLEPEDVVALSIFMITAVVVTRLRQAALESARLAEEQSALLRVATVAAESTSLPPVFQAVTVEVGRLCGADLTRMGR